MYATECVSPKVCPCVRGLLAKLACVFKVCVKSALPRLDPLCMALMEMLPEPAETGT